MDHLNIMHPAEDAQYQASDPKTSVWVSASAGTGKTKVLIDRLLRLLLQGVAPHHILCLTFTHAAASEVYERLQKTLMLWASLRGEDLMHRITAVLGRPPSEEECETAPRLLAQLLNAPSGLRIQTLHRFCQSLLQQFPLECGLQPHFSLLNDDDSEDLLQAAITHVLTACQGFENTEIKEALHVIRQRMELHRFKSLMRDLLHKRWLLGFLEEKSYAQHQEALAGFGLEPSLIPPDPQALQTLSRLLSQGSVAERTKGQTIAQWLDRGMPAEDETYTQLFFKKQGSELRVFRPTQKMGDDASYAQDLWAQEAQRLLSQYHRQLIQQVRLSSGALAFFAQRVIQAYELLKHQNQTLDYDDLILYSMDLLKTNAQTPWVLHQIQHNIHHLLIDEAQDTSPPQWQVIQALVQEIFQGDSSQKTRSLFVVGDFKQSIYSFQGADPYYFQAMHTLFERMAQRYQRPWCHVTLTRSYRSSPVLLTWVAKVFKPSEESASLPMLAVETLEAFRHEAPGHIEIWPLVAPPPSGPDSSSEDHEQSAAMLLAESIAVCIRKWLDHKRLLPARQRPVEPRDIMILLQRRGDMMEALVHSLARHHIPTAGADRFSFKDPLALQDLMMIARVALFPHDDMAMACALKGPWLKWSEDELMLLCALRPDRTSVWHHMQHTLPQDDRTLQRIRTWQDKAGLLSPYDFFSELLEHEGGRDALIQRLGMQTHEILDTFLQACLDFEQRYPATLQHWVHFLETHDGDTKRDPHTHLNQVRIMSVHSAKGLQAPIVILGDAHQAPRVQESIFFASNAPPHLVVWSPRQDQDIPETASLRQQHIQHQLQESRRLLYVALTRAEDELYIAGWGDDASALHSHAWYNQTLRCHPVV